MNIKNIIPTVSLATCSLFSTCSKGAQPIKQASTILEDPKFTELVTDTFSRKFSDETKIIEFNKLLKKYSNKVENYIIIDKKKCEARIYNQDGDILCKNEVALGRHIGDVRGGGYVNKKVKPTFSTTPGEYIISREGSNAGSSNERLYGQKVLVLNGDHTRQDSKKSQTLALHQVPLTPMGKLREDVFGNGTIKDNRVSFGCVNFLSDSFDKMRSFIKGKGTKVYILPEEKGNSLYLEKQADGSFKFFQKKYRYEYQENK